MIFVWPFLLSWVLSLALTPIVVILAKKYGFVDDPAKHKHPALIHKRVIPRAGGLPIFIAVAATSLILVQGTAKLWGILLGGSILALVGLLDDRRDLGAGVKLSAQFAAALVVVASGVNIPFITNPLGGVVRLDTVKIVADLAAIFWVVWVINMVNFTSGVDGQMPGIVFIVLMVIFAASLRFFVTDPSQIVVTQLALAGAGATLGFLFFNFYPAKIFPGDSGSYFLGYLVAVVAILSGAKVGTAILVMAVPLIDGVFTIIRRIASGKSPFLGDRKHLHHRLLELGWGQRRIALFYWLLCAILGAAALSLDAAGKIFAGVVVLVVVAGGLLWLNMNLPQRAQR